MIKLRPYQEDVLDRTRAAMRRHMSVMLQLPTGGGKTAIATSMIGGAYAKGLTAWFICHRDFLVEQTSATFENSEIEHSFVCAGKRFNPYARVQICAIDTLKNRLDRIPNAPHLMIWDEAKHIAAAGWQKVFNAYPQTRHVGLEATPARLDGKPLSPFFGELVLGPSVHWLIDEGFLSRYRCFAPPGPDLTGVKTVAGDYSRGELTAAMDTNQIIGGMVRHWKQHAAGMKTVAFATSIEHSNHIVAEFNANGIRAIHLDGESPSHERTAGARALARGEIDLISNVDLFGEGYDLAAQAQCAVRIECVILGRPTQSLAMHLQQAGRALRPGAFPTVILDHAGNTMRHGLPCQEREWTLEGRDKKKKKDEDAGPPVRSCLNCFGVYSISRNVCPHCGTAHVVEGKFLEELGGDLEEVDPAIARKAKAVEQAVAFGKGDEDGLANLIKLARARGYKNPEKWAGHVWTAKRAKFDAKTKSYEQMMFR